MTNYMNYIKNIINTETEMDKDSIEKLVKIAYYMGREEAAREGMADVIKELQKILPDVQELARKQREKLRKGNRNEAA